MILLLRSEANEHAVSIRADLAADIPKITADRVQLQQVLMNLMLNGIEAMKETGGVLMVRTGRDECGQVLISVSDTGVGLPFGREEIFNAFFTTKSHGSGMGLAISKSIVESHGGRFGPAAMVGVARRSTSPCQWLLRKQTVPGMPRDSAFSRVRSQGLSESF